jgi:hypothetical protein
MSCTFFEISIWGFGIKPFFKTCFVVGFKDLHWVLMGDVLLIDKLKANFKSKTTNINAIPKQ